ncbi:hypothetical protein WOLCODRAFT_140569 [Wolfiporia cocos MD-104 SS10]|uniref:MICOS complex subunit MIC12 n=1 Tax=Wolfiporia cocos (strain MD-104) TaxID=742152 RepID=A0A2H3JL77_WOLCO|nr:hypothetical protein WOLCODRAFT_140569 [Wolfiporia cocos MD-104 SS10]
MSFLIGPVSGAVAAGGVYYGFSTLIQTRTQQHCTDLLKLSQKLCDTHSDMDAPPPASQRIVQHPFSSMLKSQWNAQIEALFQSSGDWSRRTADWSQQVLYGGHAAPPKKD